MRDTVNQVLKPKVPPCYVHLDLMRTPHDRKIHTRLVPAIPWLGRSMSIQQEHQLVLKNNTTNLDSQYRSLSRSAVIQVANWIGMSVRQPGDAGRMCRIDNVRYN